MTQNIHGLAQPPSSYDGLKQAIASRSVTFPLRLENVAKRVIAQPELMAFGSAPSIARDCGVSATTVLRFVAHIGFRDIAEARGLFRSELRRRASARCLGSVPQGSPPDARTPKG